MLVEYAIFRWKVRVVLEVFWWRMQPRIMTCCITRYGLLDMFHLADASHRNCVCHIVMSTLVSIANVLRDVLISSHIHMTMIIVDLEICLVVHSLHQWVFLLLTIRKKEYRSTGKCKLCMYVVTPRPQCIYLLHAL